MIGIGVFFGVGAGVGVGVGVVGNLRGWGGVSELVGWKEVVYIFIFCFCFSLFYFYFLWLFWTAVLGRAGLGTMGKDARGGEGKKT